MNNNIIETRNIDREFSIGKETTVVLKNLSMIVKRNEFVSVMGPSGCGKSTLLYILGGLDRPTRGAAFFCGEDLTKMAASRLCKIRRRDIGFVFQFYNLVPNLNVSLDKKVNERPLLNGIFSNTFLYFPAISKQFPYLWFTLKSKTYNHKNEQIAEIYTKISPNKTVLIDADSNFLRIFIPFDWNALIDLEQPNIRVESDFSDLVNFCVKANAITGAYDNIKFHDFFIEINGSNIHKKTTKEILKILKALQKAKTLQKIQIGLELLSKVSALVKYEPVISLNFSAKSLDDGRPLNSEILISWEGCQTLYPNIKVFKIPKDFIKKKYIKYFEIEGEHAVFQ